MKRSSIVDLELSSDEEVWSKHSFKFSRVISTNEATSSSSAAALKPRTAPPPPPPQLPPPIESFAYCNNSRGYNPNNCDLIEIAESSSEENVAENLEDDDVDLEVSNNYSNKNNLRNNGSSRSNRSRRLVIDDDEDEDEEEGEEEKGKTENNKINNNKDEEFSDFGEEDEEMELLEEEEEEDDVIKTALQKCEKISAELKGELYGTTCAAFDTYSEIEENSSVRIVNQDDVTEACGGADSEFQPVLKPYQLVGVNFLLLLYRKKIGGGIVSGYFSSNR